MEVGPTLQLTTSKLVTYVCTALS